MRRRRRSNMAPGLSTCWLREDSQSKYNTGAVARIKVEGANRSVDHGSVILLVN